MMKNFLLVRVFLLGILFGPQLPSQAPAADDPVREMLVELRAIRRTLDRTLLVQSQLLLNAEQVKIAYQLLTTATERVDDAHAQLGLIQSSLAQATREAESLADQARQTFDPDQRTTLERQLKEQRAIIAEHQQRATELQADVARLQQQLRDAQYAMSQATGNLQAIANQIQYDATHTR